MVKFTAGFHSTLEFGHVIIISGKTRDNAENFTLNLLGDNNAYDIPFHMNVVFGENSQIIRNTKINGEFGTAENTAGMFYKETNPLKSGETNQFAYHEHYAMPAIRKKFVMRARFALGEKFTFYMLIGLDRFHISINNIHFCDYIFRSSVKRIVQCQVCRTNYP